MWRPTRKSLLTALGLAIVAAPLVAYFVRFGPHLSSNHQTWGEFGSFLAGVYAPIFALATIAILHRQTLLQERQSSLESARNISNRAKLDLEYHTSQLKIYLDQPSKIYRKTNNEYLIKLYCFRSLEELRSDAWDMYAKSDREFSPELVSHWEAINLAYFALGYDESPDLVRLQAAQRLLATLGKEACHALDNLLIALLRDKLPYKLIFTEHRGEL